MTDTEVLGLLNNKEAVPKEFKEKLNHWKKVYYGMSLHMSGAAPRFKNLKTGAIVKPPGYMGEEYQRIFDEYLMSRHPREDEETRQWRFSQYRALTMAPFEQITEILAGALFQDSNYNIDIPDAIDKEYIWQNRFQGHDIIGYFANIGIKNMMEDPNGLFLRIPDKPHYAQDENRVTVDVWFVHSKDIVWLSEDDLIFKRGKQAYWVDTQTIFSYNQNDKGVYELDIKGYYAHQFGKLPTSVAGGIWNTQGFYDSFYKKAKPIADDFVSTYSAAQMVDKNASHPFQISTADECPTCNGVGQRQIDCETCEDGKELATCTNCGGSGSVSINPGQWKFVPQEQMKENPDQIKLVNPDISINKHHREVVAELKKNIEQVLHLYRTDKAESGAAKAIDQEGKYQFISKISNHLFDKIIYDTLADIIAYRNVSTSDTGLQPNKYDFQVIKPTQFQIKTSEDLLNDYEKGQTANLPRVIRKRMALDYVQKQYSGDLLIQRMAEVVNRIDAANTMTEDEILSARASNALTQEQLIIHQNIAVWLDEAIEDKGESWLYTSKIREIKDYILTTFLPAVEPNTIVETTNNSLQQANA